jgi:hypothetical protein
MTCLIYDLQELADSLDGLDGQHVTVQPDAENLRLYLRNPSESNHLTKYADVLLGNTVLGYRLLDAVALSLGIPTHPNLRPMGRQPEPPSLPQTIHKLLKFLGDWTTILPTAQTTLLQTNTSTRLGTGREVVVSNAKLSIACSTIHVLKQCLDHRVQSDYHKILSNFYSIAFLLLYFPQVGQCQMSNVLFMSPLTPWFQFNLHSILTQKDFENSMIR